jgi:hypothetical protein
MVWALVELTGTGRWATSVSSARTRSRSCWTARSSSFDLPFCRSRYFRCASAFCAGRLDLVLPWPLIIDGECERPPPGCGSEALRLSRPAFIIMDAFSCLMIPPRHGRCGRRRQPAAAWRAPGIGWRAAAGSDGGRRAESAAGLRLRLCLLLCWRRQCLRLRLRLRPLLCRRRQCLRLCLCQLLCEQC